MSSHIDTWLSRDRKSYLQKKKEIQNALRGKTGMLTGFAKHHVFYELCFVLCVPQSRATAADKAIADLKKQKFLTSKLANPVGILHKHGVRFHKNKSKYLTKAHALYRNGRFWKDLQILHDIEKMYDQTENVRLDVAYGTRTWLVHRFSGKETPSLVEGEELPLAHNFENISKNPLPNKGLLYN